MKTVKVTARDTVTMARRAFYKTPWMFKTFNVRTIDKHRTIKADGTVLIGGNIHGIDFTAPGFIENVTQLKAWDRAQKYDHDMGLHQRR